MTRLARFELFVLIGAGAVGAGVHAALTPEHLREWAPLGTSFLAAAVALTAAVAGVALRPDDRRLAAALAVLLAAIATAYVATRVAAVPPLDPEQEPFDSLGVGTSAIEAIGLLLALHISTRGRRSPASSPGGRR